MTFKRKIAKKEEKITEEHEIEVDDPEKVRIILEGIGLKKRVAYSKRRIHYVLAM